MKNRPLTEQEIKDELERIGIDVIEPESRKEETMASALGAFSSFVLEEEKEKCLAIIDNCESAGPLQGGTEEHEIYRVSIIEDDEGTAAQLLLKEFHTSRQGKRYASVMTIKKLEQYMLQMCDRHSLARSGDEKYTELGNLMFILAFGPTQGQVRHIDNMDPNLQVCLYMSQACPSTIVYSLEGPHIENINDLIEFWELNDHILPELVETILKEQSDTTLADKSHTKYFRFWDSINANLQRFGKLYRPVSHQLSLETDPGTTLLAGGNEVHAGPPTVGPRMFAFAIGIPEQKVEAEDNNGEVQYSPALLHVDFCCILFSMMDFDYPEREEEHQEAKWFLLDLLLPLVQEYPLETYVRLMGIDRIEVRNWLGKLVAALEDREATNCLMQEAIESKSMFYSPDVCSGKTKKKRRAKKKK